ncbi:nucleoside phosphorylase domain-containing protein [Aspergillus flavus]|uniref:Nucleoside phosphorylase domain-containing protein n=1 Tax=Aspergillus flavus TaxID=5059 RepID=A0A5N6HKU1_ASPFL|nr:nucleoside phosphorylase domain-containing protein [Aspergillus flavus]
MATKNPNYNVYTVGWICIVSSEMNAARALLDEEHESLPPKPTDDNSYLLGRMNGHNVVFGYPGSSLYGPHNSSHVATNMERTFPNIRFRLLVGVGGGAPRTADAENTWNDIRLGDVVVSNLKGSHGGVLHYDADKFKDNGVFHITSHLNRSPSLLLTATQKLRSDHDFELGQMGNYISQLFISSYKHTGEGDCSKCDRAYLVKRLDRESDIPVVHSGLIASGSALMCSAQRRDQLRDEWDVCCFETEAAGLMNDSPCLVIRGICDYSDGHQNKEWEPYAAITAVAYVKDLLRVIHPETVEGTANVVGSLNDGEPSDILTMSQSHVPWIRGTWRYPN